MIRIIFSFVLASFFSLNALATELKLASYNVENLFDGIEQGDEYNDFKSGKWNEASYAKKLIQTASVIKFINADIIALQEIENESVMKDLAEKTGYKYYYFATTVRAPVGLGVLSRLPYKKAVGYTVNGHKTRRIVKVDYELDGASFSVYNVHFPAYAKGRGKERAKASANTLKKALGGVSNAIVLGDFNSPYGSGFILSDFIKCRGYVDLWREIEPKQRYSHVVGSTPRAIDHILLSPFVYDGKEGVSYVKDSFMVMHESLEKVDTCEYLANDSWLAFAHKICQYTSEKTVKKGAKEALFSDHLPIVARIKVGL